VTLGAVIICLIFTFCFVGLGAFIAYTAYDEGSFIGTIISVFVTFIVTATLWGGTAWYYHNTEDGARALKTQDSNFNGGIERQVIVYDANGDIIEEYQGKFDVEYESNQILFDDENGQRHIICFGSGTVIINEV
jgi:hypothetical protein